MHRGYDVVIVGGGHGGAQAAMALRRLAFAGSIAIIGEDCELPYDRPPLSKEYLCGDKSWERLLLRSAEAWAEREVTLLLGRRVVAVDPIAKTCTDSAGDVIDYGNLIWATGGHARRTTCPGSDLAGIHTVRNRADVDRLLAELPGARDVVVIGGGYIGLEAAAVLRKFDKRVTVLEAMDRVLARVAGAPLSRFFEAEHAAHGVDIRLSAAVECIEGRDGNVCGVRLAGGEILPAQMVIVGIGIVPATQPLLAAGAAGGNGVRVDGHCRTTVRDIFAIGDCAEHRNRFAGDDWIRLESVQNATDQAAIVAGVITGHAAEYSAVPWFWSNQYDLKLQTVGVSRGYTQVVVRGTPELRSFSVVYLRDGAVIALDCVNLARDYLQGRALVLNAARPDVSRLADATIPLKSLLAAV